MLDRLTRTPTGTRMETMMLSGEGRCWKEGMGTTPVQTSESESVEESREGRPVVAMDTAVARGVSLSPSPNP